MTRQMEGLPKRPSPLNTLVFYKVCCFLKNISCSYVSICVFSFQLARIILSIKNTANGTGKSTVDFTVGCKPTARKLANVAEGMFPSEYICNIFRSSDALKTGDWGIGGGVFNCPPTLHLSSYVLLGYLHGYSALQAFCFSANKIFLDHLLFKEG